MLSTRTDFFYRYKMQTAKPINNDDISLLYLSFWVTNTMLRSVDKYKTSIETWYIDIPANDPNYLHEDMYILLVSDEGIGI